MQLETQPGNIPVPVDPQPQPARIRKKPGSTLALATRDLAFEAAVPSHPHESTVSILASVDRFDTIACSLGSVAGRQLAAQFSQRLLHVVGRGARTMSLRDGEVALLLTQVTSRAVVLQLVERIYRSLQAPFYLGNQEIYLTLGMGIAFAQYSQQGTASLLENAQLALLQAQSEGYNRHYFFSNGLRRQLQKRLQRENDLRRGLQQGEFVLHYQPIFALDSRELVGLEALVRWEHPQQGLIFPGEFIPLAEETGLIEGLDWWVLQEACRQLQSWQQQFPQWQSLRVNVNLSSQQFSRADLPQRIDAVLAHAGLDARHLGLEIVETVLMKDADAVVAVLQRLNERGIRLCIDDFGTGYSSLSYLQRFPASFLKVDRSFVTGVACDRKTAGILRAVMMLAQQLGMGVIAEGIEYEEQFWSLKAMECGYGQGYWFSRPLNSKEVEALLAR